MANVFLNLEKCDFGCTKGILLGHIVSQDGIHTNPPNIEKVKNLPFPKTKKQLRAFFGQANYYQRFIEGYATHAYHLTKFFKHGSEIVEEENVINTFEKLKEMFSNASILTTPKHVDASNITMRTMFS
jgi:hypothetical protein